VVPWQSAASKSTAADDPQFKFFTLQQTTAAQRQQQQQQSTDASAVKGGRTSLSVSAEMASGPGLDSSSSSSSSQALEVLDCLQLNARLPWPLGVLIKQQHLDEYNALFGLLLKVKRVQLDLETAWQELGRCAGRQEGCVCEGRDEAGDSKSESRQD
jgi:hypothetical protein